MPAVIYAIILLILTVYSFSQIDLNLTLSSNSTYQSFQKILIYLGYYNRPLSVLIFFTLVLLLGIFYVYFLKNVRNENKNRTAASGIIISSVLILFFAYPAFSHDIFNYMFDARIITLYHANPYLHSALNYPDDLWIRFMHWTHRTYPYGPVWLLVTVPFSFLGFGKFVLTLLNYKLMFLIFHLGNILLIGHILKKTSPKSRIFGTVFYALNPLIIIESLVSPHNEVIMLFFLLSAFYFGYVKKNIWLWSFFIILSAGIKFTTVIIFPVYFLNFILKKWKTGLFPFVLSALIYIPVLLLETLSREPYPWYFIPLIGITALFTEIFEIRVIILALSLGTLFRYGPYLYRGDYNYPVSLQQEVLLLVPLVIALLYLIIRFLLNRRLYLKALR